MRPTALPNGMRTPPADPFRPPRFFHCAGNQRGNVAVTVALCMTLFLGMMAFALDSGFLITEKNRTQQAVEAAALAGAASLCEYDEARVNAQVRRTALANGLSEDLGTLTVEIGFYDEMNHYGDFADYRDFVAEEQMPFGEYANAVRVGFTQSGAGLTGLNPGVDIAAAAVAYLVRIDIAALDPHGEIRLGLGSSWHYTRFFSNGDIKFAEGYAGWSPPRFDHCRLLAVGRVLECPVENNDDDNPLTRYDYIIHWDEGSPQSGDHIRSGVDPLTSIQPVDDDYLDYWRERADIVYRPGDSGKDDVFYASQYDTPTDKNAFHLDLGRKESKKHRVIFFDAAGSKDWIVLVGPHGCSEDIKDYHTPNGYRVTNQTLVATCPIHVSNYSVEGQCQSALYFGGEGSDQAVFISAGDICVHSGKGCNVSIDGAVFRTGGDFGGATRQNRLRVISDGSIGVADPDSLAGLLGAGSNDSRFGPPCPPVLPRLGLLEIVDDDDDDE